MPSVSVQIVGGGGKIKMIVSDFPAQATKRRIQREIYTAGYGLALSNNGFGPVLIPYGNRHMRRHYEDVEIHSESPRHA